MLHSVKSLEGYSIGATDGVIGKVTDFYFDDESWVVRYLVVEPDPAVGPKKVLISPISIGRTNWSEKILPASITRAQVRGSPDIDTDKPVSRQHEMGYLGYYGYPNYWGGGGLWGGALYPDMLQAGYAAAAAGGDAGNKTGKKTDPHLRSGNTVMRYYVHATDGDIGHVQGLLLDDETWAIRYVIVNTSNWWLGHLVLISPAWVTDVYWAESILDVGLTRQSVKDAPPYDPSKLPDRAAEESLHGHHGRDGYWTREAKP